MLGNDNRASGNRRDPDDLRVPAIYRYSPFLDLLADAAFQQRHAAAAADDFHQNRFARASILASALCIECAANGFLESSDGDKALLKELDRLSTLSKFDVALRLAGKPGIDRGCQAVQRTQDLVAARNAHVHSRSMAIQAEVGMFQETDHGHELPVDLMPGLLPSLQIPRVPVLWSAQDADKVIIAVVSFLKYVFEKLLEATDEHLNSMLTSWIEVGNLFVASTFHEIHRELQALEERGVDLRHLRLHAIATGYAAP